MAYRAFPCFEAILWSGENSIGPRTFRFAKSRVFNRLSETSTKSGRVRYQYNAEGIRTSKSINNQKTEFLLDGVNVIGEVSNGSGVTTYLRGVTGLISQKKPDNSKLYYMTNGHGDVTALVNSAGAITKSYTYDAFGVEQNIDPADTNPFRYCGEYFDKETNSIYLRARYYNPGVGRFTQQDPAMADGYNWYVYCSGNPIKFKDPTGCFNSGSMDDFNYANNRWGFWTTMWLNGIANECLSAAEEYAKNKGLSSTWNNEADAYRHFLWNARLTREFGYYEARDITNQHEYNSLADNNWLGGPLSYLTIYSPQLIAAKMNQESFMDLWNNQVGRELANNADFKHMSYDELFKMALDNNWLITDANQAFSFLGIESYITDQDAYTVDVLWDTETGNITVYKDDQMVTLKIGV